MVDINFGKSARLGDRHEAPVPNLSGVAFGGDLLGAKALNPSLAMAETPGRNPESSISTPKATASRSPDPHQASSEQARQEAGPGGGMHIGRLYFAQGLSTIMDTVVSAGMTGLGGWMTAKASEPLWSGFGAAVTLGCAALVWNQFRSGNISWQKHDKSDS